MNEALTLIGDSVQTLGFYLSSHLPWLSGIAKLTALAVSSEVQLNSSCTVPVLISSNLHTDQGMGLRNVLRMIFVLSTHPSFTLSLLSFSQLNLFFNYFFKRQV